MVCLKHEISDKPYYGDTSRGRQETRDGLEQIAADVELLIDTLYDDSD